MVLITSYNYSYWGESKPTNITGGPHIVGVSLFQDTSNIPVNLKN